MAYTPFSQDNKNFTDKCHLLAQRIIYPKLFNVPFEMLKFEDSSLGTNDKNNILDGQMAIDRIVKVKKEGFNSDVEFMVQERFRQPKYAKYKDLTITEWNTITNLPSELYKLNAGLFVYGYANNFPDPSGFIEVVVVDTAKMIIQLIRDELNCGLEMNHRSEQTFITITFKQLYESGCLITLVEPEKYYVTQTQLL